MTNRSRTGTGTGSDCRRTRWPFRAVRGLAALALFASASALAGGGGSPGPKRVLLLDSFGQGFSPYDQVEPRFRMELSRGLGEPVDVVHVSLGAPGLEPLDEEAVVRYVQALCVRRLPDLLVTSGAPAFRFYERHRSDLLPGVPAVVGGFEERWLAARPLSPLEVAIPTRIDLGRLLENILAVQPRTEEVFVVLGDSPLERLWLRELQREWKPFASRVRLTWLSGLTFEEVLRRSSAAPPRSAVFFALMLRDVAGVPYMHERALERLRSTANAPVFGWSSVSLGLGIVGGPLLPVETIGSDMARAGVRVLRGEAPASIPRKTVPLGSPVYDARELERWGIDERLLPPGSEVRFRSPSFFQAYRGRILAVAAVVVLQAVAIAALLVSQQRRRRAELVASQLRAELAHAGRVTVLGQLSASLAHELAQPLGAILRNAEAAEIFLGAEPPDLAEIRAIVRDIKSDSHRARDVIEKMRAFLQRRELKRVPLDLAVLVDGVFRLVRPDARSRGVRLESVVARDLPPVTGDPVQLQQVLLNLFVNATEAMWNTPSDAMVLSVAVRPGSGPYVEIVVSDTGPGIAEEARPRLFEPFQTTKREGMGMGLSICRALVEAHGGQLVLEGGAGPGATFVLRLPAGEAPA